MSSIVYDILGEQHVIDHESEILSRSKVSKHLNLDFRSIDLIQKNHDEYVIELSAYGRLKRDNKLGETLLSLSVADDYLAFKDKLSISCEVDKINALYHMLCGPELNTSARGCLLKKRYMKKIYKNCDHSYNLTIDNIHEMPFVDRYDHVYFHKHIDAKLLLKYCKTYC